jgi:hypothetical protein
VDVSKLIEGESPTLEVFIWHLRLILLQRSSDMAFVSGEVLDLGGQMLIRRLRHRLYMRFDEAWI